MTSPNMEFPPNARTSSTVAGLQNVTQADIGQQQGADIQNMLDDVGISFIDILLGGFGNVVNAIGSAINKFISDLLVGLRNATGGMIDLTGFLKQTDDTANGAAAIGTDHASRILRIEAALSQGATGFDDFNRSDSPDSLGKADKMPSPWVQGGDGENLGIRGAAANVRTFITPDDGRRWARYPVPADKNQHSVTLVCGDRSNSDKACTTLILAANLAFTEFIYANVYSAGGIQLGRGTRSGTNWNFTQWKSSTYRIGLGESIEAQSDGLGKYQIIVQSDVKISHVDVSGHPIDEDHRYGGFAMQTWTGILLQKPQYSWGVETFSLRSEADTYTAIAKAQQAADSVTGIANSALTAADSASAAADAVLGVAENADAKASAAQVAADVAYAAAARWKDEFIVASAGVVLGKNELALGVVMDVPPGRTRKISRIIYGMFTNTGQIVVQLINTTPDRISTIIHSTTIPAGQIEYVDNTPDISVVDGNRISCNVLSIAGNSSVLQCAVIGALI